jgi:hypothetical protein
MQIEGFFLGKRAVAVGRDRQASIRIRIRIRIRSRIRSATPEGRAPQTSTSTATEKTSDGNGDGNGDVKSEQISGLRVRPVKTAERESRPPGETF